MLEIGPKALEAGQRMADRRRQRGLGGDLRQLRLQPALQLAEARRGPGPADGCAAFGRQAAGLLLDGVEAETIRVGSKQLERSPHHIKLTRAEHRNGVLPTTIVETNVAPLLPLK